MSNASIEHQRIGARIETQANGKHGLARLVGQRIGEMLQRRLQLSLVGTHKLQSIVISAGENVLIPVADHNVSDNAGHARQELFLILIAQCPLDEHRLMAGAVETDTGGRKRNARYGRIVPMMLGALNALLIVKLPPDGDPARFIARGCRLLAGTHAHTSY